MSVTHIREICEIADKHCDGHLRFTTRNNIEFMVDSKEKVEPLKKDLAAESLLAEVLNSPSAAPAQVLPISYIPRAGFTAIHRQPMHRAR